ncbi:STE3-domain-containing protein [Schizopora paradoxa]|uniref:STE3-domain-containing protein n=1 Tax=Schizopora paradoxa TaxID=27342 RepID=A0A0H2R2M7_9AGAM|nr:STE3-domain-containing protein [Schizopora paradoxa]
MYALTPYPITPIGCFIGFVLALLPLTSQIRKLGFGVWGFALWTATGNFIIAPVWCDITTKLLAGAGLGMDASSSAVALHLYKITHRRTFVESREQRRKTMICELLLIIGFPLLLMGLVIIVQPIRFEIVEEVGCTQTGYSYVVYLIIYMPSILLNLPCVIVAPLTSLTFIRHRKEMDEFLSSGQGITRSKYNRLMIVACMNTIFNLPPTITIIAVNIALGNESSMNSPYISWKNVHEGVGGHRPGFSLSSIEKTPASEWSTNAAGLFSVKWNEWILVVLALAFFAIFGTTPEMCRSYRSAFWFIPKYLGYKRRQGLVVETISDVAYSSTATRNNRRNSLSFLESTVDAGRPAAGPHARLDDPSRSLCSI